MAAIIFSPWPIIDCTFFIQRSPSCARGASMSRLPASTRLTAAAFTATQSSSVFGLRSSTPASVMIVPVAPHTISAWRSMMNSIRSLVSAIGLNGGAGGAPLQAAAVTKSAAAITTLRMQGSPVKSRP